MYVVAVGLGNEEKSRTICANSINMLMDFVVYIQKREENRHLGYVDIADHS